MLAVPKPPKRKKGSSDAAPKMTEDKMVEIAEKLGEALEFGGEVTITTYQRGNYEKFTGTIQGANASTKMIDFRAGHERLKISANIIVDVT